MCHIEVLLLALVICYGSFQKSPKSIRFMSSAEAINILKNFCHRHCSSSQKEFVPLLFNSGVHEMQYGDKGIPLLSRYGFRSGGP